MKKAAEKRLHLRLHIPTNIICFSPVLDDMATEKLNQRVTNKNQQKTQMREITNWM
jgi:hypothetical protein